jgi:hypothetical protein
VQLAEELRVVGDDGEVERPRLLRADRWVSGRVDDVDRAALGVTIGVARTVDRADGDGVEGVGGVRMGLAEQGLAQRIVVPARRPLLGPLDRGGGWALGCHRQGEEKENQDPACEVRHLKALLRRLGCSPILQTLGYLDKAGPRDAAPQKG